MLCYIISIESNGGSRINFGWPIELVAGILLANILIIICKLWFGALGQY